MKKDYTIHTILLCIAFAMLCNLPACYESHNSMKYEGYETCDTSYYNGEILYPDYVHEDTLIVVNADSVNWCMANYNAACDGDIKDILDAYCTPLN